ncbi:polyadenylate-binding protein RBP47-like [Salvia hispanica]|uniref:polyadenylate-binding protein RBP47-like n=1 Tax=Salvia hispanica TaxID=49212 RepID=UPI0020097210|nr:polyadenylate-binding protein RBP47-like [Salvia hispanica]
MNGGDLNQNQNQNQSNQQQQQLQHQQWVAMQQYQQQWMAMQYPAMAMQQHMMYNQHYAPYYHPQQQQYHQPQGQKQNNQIHNGAEDNKTIWIGDLQQWMDEAYIHSCFSQSGEVVSAKVIRNKQTGHSERYGFIEFNSHEAAEKVLQSFNGTNMPNTEQPFRLNWAAFSAGDRRPNTGGGGGGGGDIGSDLSIFVGDLASDVTDAMLTDTFASRYPSVKGAKVVVDANSGRSKGYGFVRFGDESERTRAMNEMSGVYCSSRPMRIGVATPKKTSQQQQQYSSQAVILAGGGGAYANGVVPQGHSENDSANTTIFVGGLDSDVTDEELRQSFTPFGEVVSVKIPAGKGCGFVQYANRSNAEDAIERLNGMVIGKQTVRLSWGRSTGNKQSRMDANGQWNGAYYGRQGYNGYGYAAASPSYGAPSNGHGNLQQPVS